MRYLKTLIMISIACVMAQSAQAKLDAELARAIMKADDQKIIKLIKQGNNLLSTDEKGQTLLELAEKNLNDKHPKKKLIINILKDGEIAQQSHQKIYY